MKSNPVYIDLSISEKSISIWKNSIEVDTLKIGTNSKLSKNFLCLVKSLLDKNTYSLDQISKIIYSNGPGSFTNLRVISSNVLAFGRGLKIPIIPISLFDAYSLLLDNNHFGIVAIKVANKRIAYKEFNLEKVNDKHKIINLTDLKKKLYICKKNIVLNSELYDEIRNDKEISDLSITRSDDESRNIYKLYIENKDYLLNKTHKYIPIYQ